MNRNLKKIIIRFSGSKIIRKYSFTAIEIINDYKKGIIIYIRIRSLIRRVKKKAGIVKAFR
jgi:hypothetical protein